MFHARWARALVFFIFISPPAFASQWLAVIGDAGLISPQLSALKDSIETERITSLVLPGDNLYWGSYGGTWNQWKRSGFTFDVVAIGNHHGGYQKEISYFGMPSEYYSTVKSGARFLVLNSDNEQTVDEQFAWLEREIQSVAESLVFLVYHHPTFDTGGDHGWRTKEKFQLRMRAFLKAHHTKLTALLLGHEHISTFVDFGPVPAVVAGSGRQTDKASPVSYTEDGFDIKTRYLAPRENHWAALEILDGARDARIHFIRVSDQYRACSALFKDRKMELGTNCPSGTR